MQPSNGTRRGPNDLELLEQAAGVYAYYRVQNVLICVWIKQGVAGTVARFDEQCSALSQLYPQGFSGIHLVSRQMSMPSSVERGQLSEIAEKYSNGPGCVALLLLGDGFWRSTLRAFVTGIRLATGGSYPLQLFGTSEELLRWFVPTHAARTHNEVPHVLLSQAVDTLRAELDL